MHPRETIQAFDRFLRERELQLEATIIGGSALVLLGVITRQTRDFDVLAPMLDDPIIEAARLFAEQMRVQGTPLDDDWLNNGSAQLSGTLPEGWRTCTGHSPTWHRDSAVAFKRELSVPPAKRKKARARFRCA